jgi:hypothetical protein
MKKTLIFFISLLIFSMPSLSFADHYSSDFLEPGNPGGWSGSLKTWDEELVLNVGEEIYLDVWVNIYCPLIWGSFWIVFDPDEISLLDIQVYDGELPGPWDPGFTTKVPDPDGPGTYMVTFGNVSPPVQQDLDGDIILSRVHLRYEGGGNTQIVIQTAPIFSPFNCANSEIPWQVSPSTVTILQRNCTTDVECNDGLWCTGDEVCAAGSCQAGPPPCPPFSICDEASSECLCSSDPDCDDGLYCNGVETCDSFSGTCDITFDFFPDYPCLDCLPNLDDCDCNEVTDSCQPVNLTVGSGSGLPGTTDNPVTVSLDTLFMEVATIQTEVCDVDDNLTCTGCEIAGRTPSTLSCVATELPSGCCQILLFDSSLSGAFIDTGTGPVFTINYSVDPSAYVGACRLLEPRHNGVATVNLFPLDVDATPGDFCFTSPPPSQSSIPTLSEWGIIIFLTLILGISVVILYRRQEI